MTLFANSSGRENYPILWAIAGSDSSGGAGIEADLRTATGLGAHCCTILTSITAQNCYSVDKVETVPAHIILSQINAMKVSLAPSAIKIGMIGSLELIRVVSAALSELRSSVVFDPVLISSSGFALSGSGNIEDILYGIRTLLLTQCLLVTPNIHEAELITGQKIQSHEDIEVAASKLLDLGASSALIKGGHFDGAFSRDLYCDREKKIWFSSPRKDGPSPRGTGCTLSSAIATALAFGFEPTDAIVIGKTYLNQCRRYSKTVGKKEMKVLSYPLWPGNTEDLPLAHPQYQQSHLEFPDCGKNKLGFYPIVDTVDWLKLLLPLGVKTVQLRIKNLRGMELSRTVKEATALARKYDCRLFINDYWDLAIQCGAYGVHLGQEDIETTNLRALSQSGLRLGLSTHSFTEVSKSVSIAPSYIAIGPIYHTTLKTMRFQPQGVGSLKTWRKLLQFPLVAIGGISLETAMPIICEGVDGIAVVSDVTKNSNPTGRVLDWLEFERKNLN